MARKKRSSATPVAQPKAAPPPVAPQSPPPPADGPVRNEALTALGEAFVSDLPEHSEGGFYQPTVRCRWAEEDIDLPDGEHEDDASEWTFTIANRRLMSARHKAGNSLA